MNKYKIEEILSNIQFQVYSDMNFIEPLGLDKETWKELLEYIYKYKIVLDKIKEKVKEELKEGRPTEEGKPEEYLWLIGYYDAYKDLNELLEEIE